ncbi:MAG: hypothetical protein ABSH20_01325, partial [Tepidisphaeraceae bacterium]
MSRNWCNGKGSGPAFDGLYANGTVKTKLFAWLTNWSVDSETVVALANFGRCRWKIENEGFNIQKNGALQSGACLQHRRMADQELLCSA